MKLLNPAIQGVQAALGQFLPKAEHAVGQEFQEAGEEEAAQPQWLQKGVQNVFHSLTTL
jgi:hypothetical protein